MKKVTGIGGVFFKSKDPAATMQWYNQHLGIESSSWGAKFDWRQADDPEKTGSTIWSPFPESTTYFDPSEKDFMINYIVHDLSALAQQLALDGVTILDQIVDSDYGKFLHIMDPDGNKIELWEPK